MTAPSTTVCGQWVTAEDVLGCGPCSELVTPDDAIVENAIAVASDILYRLSGKQYAGTCTITVRPCGGVRSGQHLANSSTWISGHSSGRRDCWNDSACGCGGISEIDLGFDPLVSIGQIKIDGAILAPTAYQIQDYRWLVRIDGGAWPCSQDMTGDPDTDDNTWQITLSYGVAPPPSGELAAKELACQLLRRCMSLDCILPERVQTVTRPGMTMTTLDPLDFLDKGKTGIPIVDQFLSAVNPEGLSESASVISPDILKPTRRVTG